MAGQKPLDARAEANFLITAKASSRRKRFFYLMRVVETPELLRYREVGFDDEAAMRSFIASGIDADMARSVMVTDGDIV